jgi:hypothetical protein
VGSATEEASPRSYSLSYDVDADGASILNVVVALDAECTGKIIRVTLQGGTGSISQTTAIFTVIGDLAVLNFQGGCGNDNTISGTWEGTVKASTTDQTTCPVGGIWSALRTSTGPIDGGGGDGDDGGGGSDGTGGSDGIDNDKDGLTDEPDEGDTDSDAAGRKSRATTGAPNPLAEIIGIHAEINPDVIRVPAGESVGPVTAVLTVKLIHSNGTIEDDKKMKSFGGKWKVVDGLSEEEGILPKIGMELGDWMDPGKDEDKEWMIQRGMNPENANRAPLRWDGKTHVSSAREFPLMVRLAFQEAGQDVAFRKRLAIRLEPEQTETSQAQFTPPAPRRFFNREVE